VAGIGWEVVRAGAASELRGADRSAIGPPANGTNGAHDRIGANDSSRTRVRRASRRTSCRAASWRLRIPAS